VKVERIPPEEITTQEGVIQVEAEAGGGGEIKIDLYIACSMSET
jgi:hypothetical protein